MLVIASDFKNPHKSAAAGKKKKRRASPAQSEASRRNSMKSTGPRDTSKTRLNALKHALCCELPVVIPGENAQEVQDKINRYIIQQGAQTEAERDAVELAVMNLVKTRRAHKADTAAETRVVNGIRNNFEDRQCLRCADLVANLAAAPAATIIELRSFTHGIAWILGQVERLETHLRTSMSLHPDQRVHAIHILGRRPQDLFTDPVVMSWNLAYLSALHGPGKLSASEAAELLESDRPEGMAADLFEFRLEGLLGGLVAMDEGQARLRETLAKVRAHLLRRLDVVEQREAVDQELAVDEAMVSVNADCMKRLRYRRENERGYQAGMRLLHQMQLMRLNYGDQLGVGVGEEEIPAQTARDSRSEAAVETPVDAPAPPAAEAGSRNEAGATQVAAAAQANDGAVRAGAGPVQTAPCRSLGDRAEDSASQRPEQAFQPKRE
jgi:hypothetical protein